MENLPKIVRERLDVPPPGEHPDANLLAAFGEDSLSGRERAEVVRHLAVCAICREITSLALPEEEKAVAVAAGFAATAPPLAAVSRGMNLRWGALAACTVIVVGLVWFTRRPTTKNAAGAVPTGVMTAAKTGETERNELESLRSAQEVSALKYASKQTAPPEQRDSLRGDKVAAKIHTEKAIPAPTKESPSPARVPASPVVAAASPPERALEKVEADSVEVAARPGAPEVDANAKAGATLAAPAPALARQKRDTPLEQKDKKTASSVAAFGSILAGNDLPANLLDGLPRWTLSNGKLRRSDDAGGSWQAVPIAENANFRALSVLGPELWVGGKDGVLYHSSDSGAHWVHIIPSTGKETLTEDIVRLEFADADHGKLFTPHRQWATNNCGASWQVQSQ